ncbi:MAG: hypothetical protein ACHQD9_00890 [Chitinophagales bacterium]
MQELVSKVSAAAGITEEQASKSIETVSAYLKERLPESFRTQVDGLINGDKLSEGMKKKLNEVASEARDRAEEMIQDVRDKADEMAGKIREMFSEGKK